jgi:hypothetical protein
MILAYSPYNRRNFLSNRVNKVERLPFVIHKKPLSAQCQWCSPVNPNYSGGRDQEAHSSKSAQANSFRDLILKPPAPQNKGLVEWLKL